MSELLMTYPYVVRNTTHAYTARAVGRQADDRMWEGWLEFLPVDGSGEAVVSGVETRQPHREHLVYWATGLTPVYLEGALQRARTVPARIRIDAPPLSEAPAPRATTVVHGMGAGPDPVLDPFEIGGRNLDILRQELTALNRPRLLNIIEAYDLNPADEDISWMTDAQLVHFIVVAVDMQLPQRLRQ